MIRVLNQYFSGRVFILIASENFLILSGIWVSLAIHTGSLRLSAEQYPGLLWRVVLVTLLCQLCMYYADVYDLRKMTSRLELGVRIAQAIGAAAILIALLFFLIPQARLASGVVERFMLVIIGTILMWRVAVEWLNRVYGGQERVLLVGSGHEVYDLAREIRARNDLPIKMVGVIGEGGPVADEFHGLPSLGYIEELERVVNEQSPDRIIIALRERRRQLPVDYLLTRRLSGMRIEDATTLYQSITGRVPVSSVRPSSLIFTDGFRQSETSKLYGRIAGFVGAILALLVAGPLMLLIALVIKLESRGPVFYKQERVGLNGKPFYCLKFRSMRADAEKSTGPVWASEQDPRITRVGKWLRLLRLDELPQFINVLRGEMSFVGPRPERPFFVQQLKEQIPFYDLRHYVRPGITGWAQVSHHYGASIEEAKYKLEYDLFYIKNCSISFDMLILFQTIKICLFGRGAR